jgi:hypothetical protein
VAHPEIVTTENDGTTTLRLPDSAAHELRDFLAAHSDAPIPDSVWRVYRLLSYAHGEAF